MALSIDIVAGGRAKNSSETELALSYLERARDAGRSLGFASFTLKEVDERKPDAFPTDGFIVALDERGKSVASAEFSRLLAKWRDAGEARVTFLIGGSDGLPAHAKTSARMTLAFGTQTWPHLLVRPMLAEQIYRAITILSGHPYHRE
ncbi:MAG: 23S rRNA (pseudouridine(1915)-N(3))-methyltransferase RlmH [Micropepsaceae bacterium]